MIKEEINNLYNLLTLNPKTALRIILDLEPEDFKFCMKELLLNPATRIYPGGHFIYIGAGWFFLNTNKQKFKRLNDYLIKNLL